MNLQYSSTIKHPRIFFLFWFFVFCFGICFASTTLPFWVSLLLSGSIIGLIILLYPLSFRGILFLFAIFCWGYYLSGNEYTRNQEELAFMESITNHFSLNFSVRGTVEKNLYNTDSIRAYRLIIDTIDTKEWKGYINTSSDFGLLLEIPRNLELSPGDIISFSSKITSIIELPLKDFSRYAWGNKLFWQVKPWEYSFIKKWPNSFQENTQRKLRNIIQQWFPPEVAGILLGITFWNIDLLDQDTKNIFRDSWLTHILVVSGSNIAFVLIILSFIFRYIPLYDPIKWTIIILFLLIYTTIVGWETPVIRATFMGILSYIAIQSNNKLNSVAVLTGIAWIFLIFKPSLLINDASFWLSFSATLGILVFYPFFCRIFQKIHIPEILISFIGVTLAATLGSLPVVLYHFWSFPLGSIFANLLISGIIGIVLIWAIFYIGAFFLFPPPILYILWIPLYFLTMYLIQISELFGNSFSRINFWKQTEQTLVLVWIFFLFFWTIKKENEDLLFWKTK